MNINYDNFAKQWIEENKEDILKDWMDICRTPSIHGEASENAPFGNECAKNLKECTDLFKRRGFDGKVFEKSGYSLISFGSGNETIGLFTHSDVVPVGDDWLYTKPFEPIIKNGALIGRGVEDNKSGIIATLCAMEIIRKYNIPLKNRLQLFIGSNEETGMEDIIAFKNEHPMPRVSLVPDADFPCSTGEKGICHFYSVSEDALSDTFLDFSGGEAFNVVLDKATVTLKHSEALEKYLKEKTPSGSAFEFMTENGAIKLRAKGVAKHACMPEGSVNAAQLLAGLLAGAEGLSSNDRKIMEAAEKILSCPFGTTLGIDFCDQLFGKLTIVNGMVDMTNGHLMLSFDMRYSSALDSDDLEARTKAAFKEFGFAVDMKENKKGFSIPDNSPIPAKLEEAYKDITDIEKKSIKLGGGTYARYIDNAFSVGTYTTTADRTTPFFEMPAGHGEAHQCDEMIDIEAFFAAVRVLIQYIIVMDDCI